MLSVKAPGALAAKSTKALQDRCNNVIGDVIEPSSEGREKIGRGSEPVRERRGTGVDKYAPTPLDNLDSKPSVNPL